jgi:two-component system sensor histidine kinase AlgZ
LILQPLVENAVVHGLAGHQGAVRVRLAVTKADDTLVLRVTNSLAAGSKKPGTEGIGLNNVRERLAVQFEGRARLVAGPSGTEWISEITMPWMHAAPERLHAARPASREAA